MHRIRYPRAGPWVPPPAPRLEVVIGVVHIRKEGILGDVPVRPRGIGHAAVVPVIVTIYADRSFSFILKTPPASVLLKKAAKLDKGSGDTGREKVGKVNRAQIKEIAEIKMEDLNANDIEAAMSIIEGTARSMGLEIEV